MAEQTPIPQPEERFGEIYDSQFLKPSTEIQLPGDPETPEDFARTQAYLETITERLLNDGLWEKQPADIVGELAQQNEWHKYEVELERKAGEKQAAYREINLQHLAAFSKRRILAFEENGWEVTHNYRIVQYIDGLINQALCEQEEFEKQASCQSNEAPFFKPATDTSKEVPF